MIKKNFEILLDQCYFFILAQMWRLLDNSYNTGNLQNRNGTWKYEEKIFTIPDEGITGIIKDQVWGVGHGYVLGLMNETLLPNNAHGNIVILEVKNGKMTEGQTWLTLFGMGLEIKKNRRF